MRHATLPPLGRAGRWDSACLPTCPRVRQRTPASAGGGELCGMLHPVMFPHRDIIRTCSASRGVPALFARSKIGRSTPILARRHNRMKLSDIRATCATSASRRNAGNDFCVCYKLVRPALLDRNGRQRCGPTFKAAFSSTRRWATARHGLLVENSLFDPATHKLRDSHILLGG